MKLPAANQAAVLTTAREMALLFTLNLTRYMVFLVTLGVGGYFASVASQGMANLGESLSRDPLGKPFRAKRAVCCALLCLVATVPAAAGAKPETQAAFDRYVAAAESRIHTEPSSRAGFLGIYSFPTAECRDVELRLRRGEVMVQAVGNTPVEIPGGLIHDWVGTAFIPGVKVAQVLALVQDYDHLARYYSPDVQASRLIARTGNDFKIYMRLRKHKVITVVLDTEYDVHYGELDADHWYSDSRSTKIAEQDGGDHGFLRRLNSYWRFVQTEDGVIVQCEAISLTRDIPTGLGWMVRPFVTSIPRESLEFTMTATRNAVTKLLVPSNK
jgi:hypothetical protein